MLRKVAAGLVGLGLIGGAGKVAYDRNGDAVVKITNSKTGKVQTVHINSVQGKTYSCPSSAGSKLQSYDLEEGRIKLTLLQVRAQESKIEREYPGSVAPHAVVVHYKALNHRDDRLVAAYNKEIDAHNAIIDRDCKAE